MQEKTTNPAPGVAQAGRGSLALRLFLLAPWPLLYLGYWSLENVKGPASEGFGVGGYASGIISTVYALSLYLMNRAMVHSRRIQNPSAGDRALCSLAKILFVAGALGLIPMLFFFYLGLPFSMPGIALVFLSLLRWGDSGNKHSSGLVKR